MAVYHCLPLFLLSFIGRHLLLAGIVVASAAAASLLSSVVAISEAVVFSYWQSPRASRQGGCDASKRVVVTHQDMVTPCAFSSNCGIASRQQGMMPCAFSSNCGIASRQQGVMPCVFF
jgi:hypothetical protein